MECWINHSYELPDWWHDAWVRQSDSVKEAKRATPRKKGRRTKNIDP